MTVSGGESLLQPAFTAAVLRRCKECGLYTALDTSGFLGARAEDALIGDRPRAADIKAFDADVYHTLTAATSPPSASAY
ncbi:hypothetical protein [Streptomyces sp. SAI-195]|uniref:hypothetical protein n=1 Tax=Streptomyces sp. SAI-195 TaxID=3377734 RepID=UPI003C7DA936